MRMYDRVLEKRKQYNQDAKIVKELGEIENKEKRIQA